MHYMVIKGPNWATAATILLASTGYAAFAGLVWAILQHHACATELLARVAWLIPAIAVFSGAAIMLQVLVRFLQPTDFRKELMLYAAAPIVTTLSFMASLLALLLWNMASLQPM